MSLVVNSNLASFAIQRSLDVNGASLRTAVQRLSSGLRINSGRDDAAGLAISERMSAQARGDAAASRNTNDCISLLQTGDQALATMVDRLQHVRELALQSLNGVATDADRRALDQDAQASLREADRIAGATHFNGRQLLDGSFGAGDMQIGAASRDTLSLDLSASVRTAKLGAIATATSADLRTLNGAGGGGGFMFAGTYTTLPVSSFDFSRPDVALQVGSGQTTGGVATNYAGAGNAATISVDGHSVALTANYGSVAGVAGAIQGQLGGAYVVNQVGSDIRVARSAAAAAPTAAVAIAEVSGANAAAFGASTAATGTPASHNTHAGFSVDGHAVSLTTDVGDASGLIGAIQSQLDAASPGVYRVSGGAAGISLQRLPAGGAMPAIGNFTNNGAAVFAQGPGAHLTLAAGDLNVQVGTGPVVAVKGTFSTAEALATAIEQQVAGVSSVHVDEGTGQLKINARQTLTISGSQAGSGGALEFGQLSNPPSGSLDVAAVTTRDGASDTVLRIDASIDTLVDRRANLGSLLSRFESISSSLASQGGIVQGARGRIVDADIAVESASLARAQVLQQAGTALLAQANARPDAVLALLRN